MSRIWDAFVARLKWQACYYHGLRRAIAAATSEEEAAAWLEHIADETRAKRKAG